MSTRALNAAFPDAISVIGVDTSPEMVAMANFLSQHIKYFVSNFDKNLSKTYVTVKAQGSKIKQAAKQTAACPFGPLKYTQANAEDTKLPGQSFDLVTIMYAFHEAPAAGRAKILREARRLLHPGGTLAVVDIATDYTPSPHMLAGEPYVQEYQKNIHRQLSQLKGFAFSEYKVLIPGHVGMWVLKRSWA
jgi:ubiquinone/menaquinone biosynthesis C-methylase UbiE